MEIKQDTYHALGDSTDKLMRIINNSMETLDTIAAGITQFKGSLQMMECYVAQQKQLLLSIIIEAPFPKPQPVAEEEEQKAEEEEEEEEQKIEEEEEESSTTTTTEEEEEKHEEEEEEEEQQEEEEFIYDPDGKKIGKIVQPFPKPAPQSAPTVPIAATAEARYARKPYKVLLQVSQKVYNQYAYLYKKVLKLLEAGKEFEGQMFQHHVSCIRFVITTKIADVEQLFENTKSAVHWAKKLKKTEGYKNKEAQKFAGKLLETLRKMKSILKNL